MASIKVLIADDSAFLRKSISNILKEDKSIEIIDTAVNGKEAIDKVNQHHPDVLILDLLMPKMDGLEAFKHIMDDYPIPTIILSAVNPQNMDTSVQALLMGAFDYIIKPGGIGAKDLPRFRKELRSKVLLASQSQIKRIYSKKDEFNKKITLRQQLVDDTFQFGVYLRDLKPIKEERVKSKRDDEKFLDLVKTKVKSVKNKSLTKIEKVEIEPSQEKVEEKELPKIPSIVPFKGVKINSPLIVMGASVGGPRTIRTILKDLPKNIHYPILIVQHLSEFFLESFVKSLDAACKIKVKIGNDGEHIFPGIAYVAPGGYHMEIQIKNNEPCIKIFKGEPVNFCIPSVDVLFFSAARTFGPNVVGVLLTGMGKDGVEGLGSIKLNQGKTIAESEETCVLYGMPRFAKERGVTNMILPDYKIGEYLRNYS